MDYPEDTTTGQVSNWIAADEDCSQSSGSRPAGRAFNIAFEIDQSTATMDSSRDASLRHRLDLYDAYQDPLLRSWLASGRTWERPRFRVVFLTPAVQRSYHILAVAGDVERVAARRFVLAVTQDEYLGATDRLQTPHFGSVVPIAFSADRLGQAARRSRDDRPRRFERQQLERQGGTQDDLAPAARVGAFGDPALPVWA